VIVFASLLAAALIVASGLAVWAFLRFVKSFGAYTESYRQLAAAILTTHESNLLLHRANMKVFEELQKLHPPQRERSIA